MTAFIMPQNLPFPPVIPPLKTPDMPLYNMLIISVMILTFTLSINLEKKLYPQPPAELYLRTLQHNDKSH